MKRMTTNDFVSKSILVHGDKYDYSMVEYNGNKSYVTIICKKHGEFKQRAANHLLGRGCIKCQAECASSRMTMNTEEFIMKAKLKHGDLYDYGKTVYKNGTSKIIITCKKHGDFLKSPDKHLSGQGCQKCSGKGRVNTHDFVFKSNLIHSFRYKYDKTICKKVSEKVIVTCGIHGDFMVTPSNHLKGRGCPGCAKSGFDKTKNAYVYFLISEYGVKVGITNKITQRLATLKRETPFNFNEIHHIKMTGVNAAALEKYFHKKYESAGLTGFDGATEWLKHSSELMDEIMNKAP